MLAAGCGAASMEASSHALDQDRTASVVFASAGFTNLTQDHFRATAAGTAFTLSAFGATAAVDTALIGEYNVSNILCAAAMTVATGIPLNTVAEAVSAAKPRWGRLEPFDTPAGARVFVDYAHSPDAISRALAALRRVSKGRTGADFVIVTSDNPRSEAPEAIIDEAVAGFSGLETPWRRIADRRDAIAAAIAEARNGDVVLLAGKGHENYQEIAGVRHHFDDRETVRELCAI